MKWWRLLLGGLAALSVSAAGAQVAPRSHAPGFKSGLRFFGTAGSSATAVPMGKQADGNTGNPVVTITATATCGAGSYIVVVVGTEGTSAPTNTIGDTGANPWVTANGAISGTSMRIRLYYTQVTTALLASQSISVTFGNGTSNRMAIAACLTGLAASPFDTKGAPGLGTMFGAGTVASITAPQTGTFTTNDELIVSWVMWSGAAADTLGAAPGFNVVDTALLGSALRLEYRIVSSSAAISYTPTDGASRNWVVDYAAFKATP